MGFELEQGHSCLESVNEFKEKIEDALMEAKAALWNGQVLVRATCKLRGDRDSKESGESIKTNKGSNS